MAMPCPVPDVSSSGYYAWRHRPASRRVQHDRELMDSIRAIHTATRGTYRAPRVWAELRVAQGIYYYRERVAALMRQMGLQGRIDAATGASPAGRSSRTACIASG